MKLSSTVLTDAPGLVALRRPWEQLVARSADDELNSHPAWLDDARAYLMRAAIESGAREYDFLGGISQSGRAVPRLAPRIAAGRSAF